MTLGELRKRLDKAWCVETTSIKCAEVWSQQRASLGQCIPTALIVQDLFGGTIIKVRVNSYGYGYHYYNELPDGTVVDITRDQFPEDATYYEDEIFPRWKMFEWQPAIDAKIPEQYALLKTRLGLE